MKSYLDLIPILAKVHKKQNRMSKFCIILSVFLVAGIFGMADMFIRSQILQSEQENGRWHIAVKDISEKQAAMIAARPDVKSTSPYGVVNYRGQEGYTLAGKDLILCGSDESYANDMLVDFIAEGMFPKKTDEAVITENAKKRLGLEIGSRITAAGPDGTGLSYTITGFTKDVPKTMSEDSYGVFLTTEGFRALTPGISSSMLADYNSLLYVRFAQTSSLQKTIGNMKAQMGFSDQQISENTKLLGLLGQSRNSFMTQTYTAAGILGILVMASGILMIASSLNSNISQRTEFFGMIRCIGATPKQIMSLVRKEAVGWCRFAIPAGIFMGTVLIWILCALLRFLSPVYFQAMPAFGVSLPSIFAGVCIGLLTVLLAARSPAKRASRVSPLTAVSGGADEAQPVRKAASAGLLKIDTALGIHHAKANRKNFLLMIGSFSLSIILFLCFTVTIDFMNHAMTPLRPWSPDLSIISPDSTRSVDSSLINEIKNNPAVKRIYGRMFVYDVPVEVNGKETKTDLISYEENQFRWAADYLLEGSLDEVQKNAFTGLIVYEPQNAIQTGDVVTLDTGGKKTDIKIAGMLSSAPFDNAPGTGTIICSEDTIRQLTGQAGYTIIDIQTNKNIREQDVELIRRAVGPNYIFSDERLGNQSTLGSYYSMGLFIYGFLALIAIITVFNIINSVSMSVSARMKQYGVLRAIGLSHRQLAKMVAAEAFTYAAAGFVCGCLLGIPLHRLLYGKLITFHWNDPWRFPVSSLAVITAIVLLSVLAAVWGPLKRIRRLSIVDTISAE